MKKLCLLFLTVFISSCGYDETDEKADVNGSGLKIELKSVNRYKFVKFYEVFGNNVAIVIDGKKVTVSADDIARIGRLMGTPYDQNSVSQYERCVYRNKTGVIK